ncbi:MAG: hypothetical protein C4B59_08680 [Candidatus Methanogaster sp.]|uniref:Uncharacterized protein n=1 Tax=Candidatus Methanogaster sp. TaxID=3386292 RepID=A0AC61L2Z8_9EURY|nr:MAG: hypothetical protein C4B59_08680 [ANME-2 cluster archaeon]
MRVYTRVHLINFATLFFGKRLAAYMEEELPDIEIGILDCQAERKDWKGAEETIESFSPSIVATS